MDHGPIADVVSIYSAPQLAPAALQEATSLEIESADPHEPTSPSTLVVSAPIDFLENCEVKSIAELCERIKIPSVLPQGM